MKSSLSAGAEVLQTATDSSVFTSRLESPAAGTGPLSGLKISVKDNIDVAGVVTSAGARAFLKNAPALADAPVVSRLREAGAHVFAKTNMTEFAYSTLGFNAYFGTPINPWRSEGDRIPGGSSSGAAVAVALGIGDAAIGTDTAGSSRLPAALCGVVGFKARSNRVSRRGIVPLAPSHDAVGVLAPTVDLAALVFSAISADAVGRYSRPGLDGERIRLLLPHDGDVDPEVQSAFSRAIDAISGPDIEIVRKNVPLLQEVRRALSNGGLTAYEALAFHEPILAKAESLYEPYTLHRLENARKGSQERYRVLLSERDRLRVAYRSEFSGFHALLMPTAPMVAPLISDLQTEDAQLACGIRLMENSAIANALDLPSISVPCHEPGRAPVGLMLTGIESEEQLLAIARIVERRITET